MSGFIELHPKNPFEGLLLVNVDDIRHVYQVGGHSKEKWAVISLQGPDTKPIDLQGSYKNEAVDFESAGKKYFALNWF